MFGAKPIIGLAGGIGSGKSHVARLFAELHCQVIDSDAAVHRVYESAAVKRRLVEWWGESIRNSGGKVDRRQVAARVFDRPEELRRLNALVHPLVAEQRKAEMEAGASELQTVAFVWDTPLLFEAGLAGECDSIVFVDADPSLRLDRVRHSRGWSEAEWQKRENLQWPLDKKRGLSDYVIASAASPDELRGQVRNVLSQILSINHSTGIRRSPDAQL